MKKSDKKVLFMPAGVLFLILGIFLLNFISASTIINFTTSNALQSNSVNDVFIYDITADSTDYTTWHNDSSASWWLEMENDKKEEVRI